MVFVMGSNSWQIKSPNLHTRPDSHLLHKRSIRWTDQTKPISGITLMGQWLNL